MFGHTFELVIVLLLGLLIFGPKRVIEMGSAAGKMLRELRDAVKDMNWSAMSGDEHGSDPLAELRELRDLPRTFASSILNPPPATSTPAPTTDESPSPGATTATASAAEPAPNGSVPAASAPAEPAE